MKRISTSIPNELHERIEKRATKEGRSVSNLVAFLIEQGMNLSAEKGND